MELEPVIIQVFAGRRSLKRKKVRKTGVRITTTTYRCRLAIHIINPLYFHNRSIRNQLHANSQSNVSGRVRIHSSCEGEAKMQKCERKTGTSEWKWGETESSSWRTVVIARLDDVHEGGSAAKQPNERPSQSAHKASIVRPCERPIVRHCGKWMSHKTRNNVVSHRTEEARGASGWHEVRSASEPEAVWGVSCPCSLSSPMCTLRALFVISEGGDIVLSRYVLNPPTREKLLLEPQRTD